jgi:hypothetical protein
MFWYQSLCLVHNSFDVLNLGQHLDGINIPSKKPHAGVEEMGF